VATRFAYDPLGNAWADLDSSGSLTSRRLYLDAVDAVFARMGASGGEDWYLTDRLGSVRDIVNSSGSLIDHLDYDSFGAVATETQPSNGDRYKFSSREFDAETGLQYNRARYYQVDVGRWLNEDPLRFGAGDANLYRYVGNNATNATDPGGMSATSNLGGGSQFFPERIDLAPGSSSPIAPVILEPGWFAGPPTMLEYIYAHAFTDDGGYPRPSRPVPNIWDNWLVPLILAQDSWLGHNNSAHGGGWFVDFSNFMAGWSDKLTGGASIGWREWMGTNDVVNMQSGAYENGQIVGIIHNDVMAVASIHQISHSLQNLQINFFTRPGGGISFSGGSVALSRQFSLVSVQVSGAVGVIEGSAVGSIAFMNLVNGGGETNRILDDKIAEHAIEEGHWPGLDVTKVKELINDVRNTFQNRYISMDGRIIYRKGDIILIEDIPGNGGTIFRPSPQSALQFFQNWVFKNP
jgi:RHS repeat-associated protein